MISCDTIIENGALYLRNLNKGATSRDVWSTTTAGNYCFYNEQYEHPLQAGHIYYLRCNYKFTTTNQSPTWVTMYLQGGAVDSTAKTYNPVAGTEYTLAGIGSVNSSFDALWLNIYNGQSGAISGVIGQAKNVVVYDVTYLYKVLKGLGIVTDHASLTSWCTANLEYKNAGVVYDITSLIDNLDKITMFQGGMCCEPVECDGMEYYSYSNTLRQNTYFDNGIGVYVYNNNGNGAVTHTRVEAKSQNSPFYPEHKYILQIKTNGTAQPSCGGFYAEHVSAKNKIFIEKFVAKVPVGYNVTSAYNAQGDGSSVTYLTPRAGTGNWEEYAILYKCGTGGTFSTGGHVYLEPNSGYSSTAVTWYLAYVNNCDITTDESLKNYTVLPNKDVIKGNKVFSNEFNTGNFISNGECSDSGMTLPSGWTFDDTDIAGNGVRSIVQPVGAGGGTVFGEIKINPQTRYKLSYWVKCKRDMTSFLTTIYPYTAAGASISHSNTVYLRGTKTTLSEALVSGATQMKVSSNANWVAKSYSSVGFRVWGDTYNRLGTFANGSTGAISGTSGSNIVLFKTPYKGSTIAAGTNVVESFDGSNYPYPVGKESLPTDNTWKYVEGYFGGDMCWDGVSEAGGGWPSLPGAVSYIILGLNLYANDGTVPIKYCDIKLEQVGSYGDGERKENKIQFKKHN
jgi:hypothetical protein